MDELERPRRLSEVVREMKIAEAERLDMADRDGEAARQRLEALAAELSEVFEEAGGEAAGFDFQISRGSTPRLWIDAAAHVALAHDGETFRIMRDNRGGRTILAETDDLDEAADCVTRYIATRSLERERLLDEAPAGTALASASARPETTAPASLPRSARPMSSHAVVRGPSRFARFVRALLWFALGLLTGFALLFLAYGERLGFENPVPLEYRPLYEPYVPPTPLDAPAASGDADPATNGSTTVTVVPVEPVPEDEAGTE